MSQPRSPSENCVVENDDIGEKSPLLRGSRRHTYASPGAQYLTTTGILPDMEGSYSNNSYSSQRSRTVEHNDTAPVLFGNSRYQDDGHNDKTNPSTISTERSLDPESVGVFDQCALSLVTIMIMLALCASRTNSILINQYLYQFYATGIFGNLSVDTSRNPCADSTNFTNSTERKLVKHVQDLTSQMNLYLDMTSYGISAVSNLLLGTFSIVMSRKLLLLIPNIGFFLRICLAPIIIHWQLDVKWFYVGYGIDGICGSSVGILLGTFLYTSDITPRNSKRTLGVAIVETTKGIVGAAFYGATGQLIERTGYMIPSSAAAGLQLMAVFLVLTFPDRKPVIVDKEKNIFTPKGAILHMFSPFHGPKNPRVKKMVMISVSALFIIFLARMGVDKIETLYMMNVPFCFDAITIGWYLFGRELGQNTAAILMVAVCHRCIPGMGLGIVSAVSSLACFLMYAFANVDWHIYLVPVLGLASQAIFSMLRGETSRLLGPEYQGPLFACIAVLESISFAAGSSISLAIYNASLDFFTGLAFGVDGSLMLIGIVLLGIYQRLWVKHMRDVQYKTLDYQEGIQQTVPSDP